MEESEDLEVVRVGGVNISNKRYADDSVFKRKTSRADQDPSWGVCCERSPITLGQEELW